MAPDNIPLAQGGADRDGLEMDELHVPLGPVLPYWPAGLVLRCSLQGDVIVDASARLLDPDSHQPGTSSGHITARRCDRIATFLALAGWDDGAAQARCIRDDLLLASDLTMPVPAGSSSARRRIVRLERRVARSLLLRWSLRGVRPLQSNALAHWGLPARLQGDTYDRLRAMIAAVREELSPDTEPFGSVGHDTSDVPVEAIAQLVIGLELATARLLVASLDLDRLRSGGELVHASHGHD